MIFDMPWIWWYTVTTTKEKAQSVDDLLTTRQLQDLLQVDRITIYRMLSDGRLHGFKVGGQWRFPRQEIEAWLQELQSQLNGSDTVPQAGRSTAASSQVLPLSCIKAIQDVCAEALDIAAVTTDLDGSPLSSISNSCDFCRLVLSSDEGRRRCAAAWKQVNAGQVHPCHAGLLCVSAPIQVSDQWVAIAAGCQFIVPQPDGTVQPWHTDLPLLAADLSLAEGDLQSAAGTVRVIPDAHLQRVSRLVMRVADTFSEIGQERLSLLSRLQHIAEMSKI
jgi:excisionase family DNA binding protein